jgi:hypothetical protein
MYSKAHIMLQHKSRVITARVFCARHLYKRQTELKDCIPRLMRSGHIPAGAIRNTTTIENLDTIPDISEYGLSMRRTRKSSRIKRESYN